MKQILIYKVILGKSGNNISQNSIGSDVLVQGVEQEIGRVPFSFRPEGLRDQQRSNPHTKIALSKPNKHFKLDSFGVRHSFVIKYLTKIRKLFNRASENAA